MHTQGPEGFCICLRCGRREAHEPGIPCRNRKCPQCGAILIREGSEHHRAHLDRIARKATETAAD